MKAKCIKADPLEILSVGTTYEISLLGNVYYILGTGFAMNKENFNEHFEEVKE